jgi:STAM-binding protein
LLLFRHAELVLRNLRNHPQAELPEGRQALLVAEKEVVSSLGKLELLKPRINKKFQRFEQLVKEREARKPFSPIRKQSIASEFASLHYGRMATDPAMAGFDETIAAGDNPDLAVKLAHTEIRRRATRKATRQAGIPEEVEQARRTAGVWGEWDKAFSRDDDDGDREALSRQMQSIRLQTAEKKDPSPVRGRKASLDKVEHSYRYPEVPSRKTWSPPPPPPLPRIVTSQDTSDRKPPLPPPKDALVFSPVSGPAIPKKIPFPSSDLTTPTVNGTSSSEFRPSSVIIQPSAYLENGSPLRTMYLDPDLRHRFLSIAEPNTRANLETCGVLCGTLISNALFIRKLVIPEQKSTSDTCETVNESALFDYVDGEDLMVLGWIHTHPTQTCFMSSRDLHTHAGYQVMMSESIAIVCAPSKDEYVLLSFGGPYWR